MMKILSDTFLETIRRTGNVVLVTHIKPDVDALGSVIGLAAILEAMGKKVFRYLEEPLSHLYRFLPDSDLFSTDLEGMDGFIRQAGDDIACITLDCGDRKRMGTAGPALLQIKPLLVIDHHKGNEGFGDLAWIDADRSSTGEMVFDLAAALGQPLSLKAATALYAAIVTDTGSFRYEATSAHTFDVARQLVNLGVRPHEVSQHLYDNYSIERLRLLQMVLATLEVVCEGRVAFISVTRDILERTGCSMEDTENFINLPRAVSTVEVAVFMKEGNNNFVSVSLRAKNTCDVAEIASRFGGGGHRNAAGFKTAVTTLDEVRARLLGELRRELGC